MSNSPSTLQADSGQKANENETEKTNKSGIVAPAPQKNQGDQPAKPDDQQK